jgi:hypothetical protein
MSLLMSYARSGVREPIPRFLSLSLDNTLYAVARGESVAVTVTLERTNVTAAVDLSVSGLPAGTTGVFSPATLTGDTLVSTLTLTASGPADLVNLQTVTVIAQAGAGLFVTSRTFLLTVEEQPGTPGALFVLSTSASAINLVQDATATVTLNLVRANPGYTETVTPSIVESLPSGVTVEYSPATFAGSTTSVVATFTATDVATVGVADLTIRGTGTGSEPNDTPLRLNVVEAGTYARLAPLADLPRNEAGTPLGYDSTAGGTTGNVYRPTELLRDPAWLAANTNVVTVKASGGDYTPATFQAAVNTAYADTLQDWTFVIDTGLTIERSANGDTPMYTVPARPSGSTRACHFVPSDWYEGTWTPSDTAHFAAASVANCFRINNTHTFTGDGQGAIFLQIQGANTRIVGMSMQRPSNFGAFAFQRSMCRIAFGTRNVVMEHCSINGQAASGTFLCRNGLQNDGTNVLLKNIAVYGFSRRGVESCAIFSAGGAQHQYEWVLGESASINWFSGGQQMITPDGLHDVLFRKCHFPKRQQFNRASHLYAGLTTVKNNFEPKYGTRILCEDCVFENSFAGDGSNGDGVALSVTNQDPVFDTREGYIYEVSNVVLLNCMIRNAGKPLRASGYQSRVNTKPMYNLDFVNVLAVIAPAREYNYLAPSGGGVHGEAFDYNRPGQTKFEEYPDLFKNIRCRWVTFGHNKPSNESLRVGVFLPQVFTPNPLTSPRGDGFENCVFADARQQLATVNPPDPVRNGVAGLDITTTLFRKCAVVRQSPVASSSILELSQFPSGTYPDMQNAGYFAANRAALGFTDPANFDYSLSESAPAKGLGDDGFDPGYDKALMDTRLSGVRANLLGLQIEWVEAP